MPLIDIQQHMKGCCPVFCLLTGFSSVGTCVNNTHCPLQMKLVLGQSVWANIRSLQNCNSPSIQAPQSTFFMYGYTTDSALRSGPVRFFHPFGREPGPDRFYIFHKSTKNRTGPYRTGPLQLRAVTGPVLTSPDQLFTCITYNYTTLCTSY